VPNKRAGPSDGQRTTAEQAQSGVVDDPESGFEQQAEQQEWHAVAKEVAQQRRIAEGGPKARDADAGEDDERQRKQGCTRANVRERLTQAASAP